MYCTSKIVVFDLDETLGYFSEFAMFWYGLVDFMKIYNIDISIDQYLFDSILDLFPEFLRPNIINILNYLKKKKMAKHCNKLMIYTNNQGPNEWTQQIQKYFETKLNYKLFDQIIGVGRGGGTSLTSYVSTGMLDVAIEKASEEIASTDLIANLFLNGHRCTAWDEAATNHHHFFVFFRFFDFFVAAFLSFGHLSSP